MGRIGPTVGHSRPCPWRDVRSELEHHSNIVPWQLAASATRAPALDPTAVEGIHPHDLGTFLDYQGIAGRAGHHCAQPLMRRLGVVATTRASFPVYTTLEEIDRLVAAVRAAQAYFDVIPAAAAM